MDRTLGGCGPFSSGDSWVSSNTMWPGLRPTFVPTGILIYPLFGHNRHGQKSGRCALFLGGIWVPHLTQCRLGRGLPVYQVASGSIQPFGHNRHGPKIGELCPFGGELGPHLIQYGRDRAPGLPHAKFHLDPSNRLATTIHQRPRHTDRQTGETGETTVRQRRVKRFANGRPKTDGSWVYIHLPMTPVT